MLEGDGKIKGKCKQEQWKYMQQINDIQRQSECGYSFSFNPTWKGKKCYGAQIKKQNKTNYIWTNKGTFLELIDNININAVLDETQQPNAHLVLSVPLLPISTSSAVVSVVLINTQILILQIPNMLILGSILIDICTLQHQFGVKVLFFFVNYSRKDLFPTMGRNYLYICKRELWL